MGEGPETGGRSPGGAPSWTPPKRPGPLRTAAKRGRRRLAPLRAPQPAPPPPIPKGWETGPPDFVGVGAQRAGTSRWFGLICSHPEVCIHPRAAKEIQFHTRWDPGPGGEAGIEATYARYFPRLPGTLSGEWTPDYVSSFWAIPRLRRAAPEAKLLAILRDPIDRYASGLARLRRHARETAVEVRPLSIADAAARSAYGRQLEHLFAHYPREQVLVLQYERCVADPARELERTWDFLGLPAIDPDPERLAGPVNRAGAHPDLPGDVVAALARWLASDIARLPELVPEIDLARWEGWSAALRRLGHDR